MKFNVNELLLTSTFKLLKLIGKSEELFTVFTLLQTVSLLLQSLILSPDNICLLHEPSFIIAGLLLET